MKPFYVLLIGFTIFIFTIKLINGNWDYTLSANIAMSLMLLFTAVGHFAFTKGMTMMLPDFVPMKSFMIYFTGVLEIMAAVGLLLPSLRLLTSALLILFFSLILPCNIYAAIKKIDYQKATFDGPGISYLWLRVPLQLIFIAWVYVFNCARLI